MKFVKLSLAAIMAMGISAYAETKVSGDARLYYGATDYGDADLFDKAGAYGNAAIAVDVKTDLTDAVKFNGGLTYLTTMGLEGTLVSATWAGGTGALTDSIWLDEANLVFNILDKTAMIVGRQYIDTPLAFSETWNIVANSMDAAVIADTHIPKTTLIAAWIGRGNGAGGFQVVDTGTDKNLGGNFVKYHGNGAYAFGAVTEAIPLTTAQAWYYDVESVAQAFWLQADVAPKLGESAGLDIGVQYANLAGDDNLLAGVDDKDTDAFAVKLGGEVVGVTGRVSYSTVSEGALPIANTATGPANSAQTKLYTEAWWNFGYVGLPDTEAWNLTLEYSAENIADFGFYYTGSSTGGNGVANVDDSDMTDITVTVGKSFGALDASLAYIYTDSDTDNVDEETGEADAYSTVQVYLTYNF